MGLDNAAFSPVGTVGYEIADATPTRVTLTVEANAAKPTATQLVYDALYWAERRMRDLKLKLRGGADPDDRRQEPALHRPHGQGRDTHACPC